MQPKQDMLIAGEDNNVSDNFNTYLNKKFILDEQDIEKNYKDLVDKNVDTQSCTRDELLKYTSQDRFLVYELSLFLKEIKFSE